MELTTKEEIIGLTKLRDAIYEFVARYGIDHFSHEMHRNITQFAGYIALNVYTLEQQLTEEITDV